LPKVIFCWYKKGMGDDSTNQEGPDGSRAKTGLWARSAAWVLADLAIVAAAIAVVYVRTGMGLVCYGLPVLLIGYCLHQGVMFFVQRLPLRRRVSLGFVACLSGAAVAYTLYITAPGYLFDHYVMLPRPASVKILESQFDGSRDPAAYLYFEANPADMETIIRSRPYTLKEDLNVPLTLKLNWWKPDPHKLQPGYFWETPDGKEPKQAAWLFVDDTKTKAYFAFWFF
jgi:hypothetical protein